MLTFQTSLSPTSSIRFPAYEGEVFTLIIMNLKQDTGGEDRPSQHTTGTACIIGQRRALHFFPFSRKWAKPGLKLFLRHFVLWRKCLLIEEVIWLPVVHQQFFFLFFSMKSLTRSESLVVTTVKYTAELAHWFFFIFFMENNFKFLTVVFSYFKLYSKLCKNTMYVN